MQRNIEKTASKILNLPVHQDVQKDLLIDMCKIIKEIIGDNKNEK